MSRKRKELPVIEGVRIHDVAAEGNAVARVDEIGGVYSVWRPRRCGRRETHQKEKSYAEGQIVRVVEPSPEG